MPTTKKKDKKTRSRHTMALGPSILSRYYYRDEPIATANPTACPDCDSPSEQSPYSKI